MSQEQMGQYIPGLEGVVAAQTRLSNVNGLAGELIIGGFPVEELAGNATFEEVVYLLWNDRLPTREELGEFKARLLPYRELPQATLELLRAAAERQVRPMDALRMGADSLGLTQGRGGSDDTEQGALAMVAGFPSVVAAHWRMLQGQEPVAPREDLRHAANYLYMLTGEEPSEEHARGLETYLNTVSDHGLNASTFTARVIISTQSDIISAVVGAIGALKGPLHGGAPGPALDMVLEIGEADKAETYLREKLERGERLMGFGHRVYKVRDPRADVLSAAAEKMYRSGDDMAVYELSKAVEQKALELLEEYKPGRRLQTNVEFFTALLLNGIGLHNDLFSPTFAIGRVAGWTGHAFEQQAANRLIRPRSEYVGVKDRKWVPIEER
ncbi:MAG: citrate synthase/methylcitrate synthase [Chloroflexota bacterium]|nr:citrate synthase/methylcitrate synthase [Chloroflexota bacterium]